MEHFTESIALYLTVTYCRSLFYQNNELFLSVVSKQYVNVHMSVRVFVHVCVLLQS